MNKLTIGTCSLCGGPVTVPAVWWGVMPPTPTCDKCGAEPVEAHGPVIPMRPRRCVNPYSTITVDGKIIITNPDFSIQW